VSILLLIYLLLNNGMPLKSGLKVIQDIEHTTSCQSAIVNIAPTCTVFELVDIEKYCDLEN